MILLVEILYLSKKLRHMFKVFGCFLVMLFLGCSSSSETENTNAVLPTLGKGKFTILGNTYQGVCNTFDQSDDFSYYWYMSIQDNARDASLGVEFFPKETSGIWDLAYNYNNYSSRKLYIIIGSKQYKGEYGAVTKLSKTKFTISGTAYEYLGTVYSEVAIPFTVEGDLIDLSYGNASDIQYPEGKGIVSMFAENAIPDTLDVFVFKVENSNMIYQSQGKLSHQRINPECGQSEYFFFATPGQYHYYTQINSQGIYTSGDFEVIGNSCNLVNIN